MKTYAIAPFGGLLPPASVAPSPRISTGLRRCGLGAGRSDRVGTHLEGDLSLGQLRQLGRATAAYRGGDATPGALTANDLPHVASEPKDPTIALAAGQAAAGCGVFS